MALKEGSIFALLIVAFAPANAYYYSGSGGCSPNLFAIYWCSVSKLGVLDREERCSWNAMKDAFNQLVAANCKNCDKYFHCMGNYNAVYGCQRSSKNIYTAKAISDCREGDCQDADSAADQRANLFGRNGGDCASRYLCDVNCKYNPRDRSCKKSNC